MDYWAMTEFPSKLPKSFITWWEIKLSKVTQVLACIYRINSADGNLLIYKLHKDRDGIGPAGGTC